ncbi:hypothetical protein PPGU19_033940 [Paraburkholderia sp. PGU19]|uniref:WbqC family protein n=1 Tax=Paraburkholderia sp. PGU19 TaxID=2735434 RepID=UPI0015DC4AC5|nr:WbqC family protein [Paraburkholderia sp. PGU19]BCF98825.1 hypothetical protein PPGU19_033940 [Paraburkholderia sp. PGU19]
MNPAGGRELFNCDDFAARNISLQFLSFDNPIYDVGPYRFEPGLSIIDVLMWNSPQSVMEMLRTASTLQSP